MSDNSHIQWTDATWPITTGCTEAGPDCLHCYARQHSWRLAHNPNPKVAKPYQDATTKTSNGRVAWSGTIKCLPERLDWPLKWKQPRRIFVANMSDLFHEGVSFQWIDVVFGIMTLCPQHTFQVLTKRPDRMLEWSQSTTPAKRVEALINQAWKYVADIFGGTINLDTAIRAASWPLPNVWLGTSVGTQKAASERIPLLQKVPAAVRFLSCEPLLEKINIAKFLWEPFWTPSSPDAIVSRHCFLKQTSWVIVGGESGYGARPCDLDWINLVVQSCKDAGVPVFVKQLGTGWVTFSPDKS